MDNHRLSRFERFLNPLRLYDPRRPADRAEHLWGYIYPIVAFFVFVAGLLVWAGVTGLPAHQIDEIGFIAGDVFRIAYLLLALLIIYRRFLDLGMSPSWYLAVLVPLLNLYVMLRLFLKKGQRGQVVPDSTEEASARLSASGLASDTSAVDITPLGPGDEPGEPTDRQTTN